MRSFFLVGILIVVGVWKPDFEFRIAPAIAIVGICAGAFTMDFLEFLKKIRDDRQDREGDGQR